MSEITTDALAADLSSVSGVGPKMRELLTKLTGGATILDLLFHLPNSWIDRTHHVKIGDASPEEVSTITAAVDRVTPSYGRAPAKVRLRDETGFLTLVYFRANKGWLERTFKPGAEIIVSGIVQEKSGERQMSHPDHVGAAEGPNAPPEVEPIYPLTAGVTGRQLRKFICAALDGLDDPTEWVDQHELDRRGWPSFRAALEQLHRPQTYDREALKAARERLAYDEALAREIALGQARLARERQAAPVAPPAPMIERTLVEALGFSLTRAQRAAFADISSDISDAVPMRRLLQGDVGSGKTIVAALATAQMAAAGKLTAFMSPTEVLAQQQAKAFNAFLAPVGFRCVALTSSDKGAQRKELLRQLRAGEVAAVSGTQSLYQSDVEMPNLGLIVIDEQHRFGVADRMKLASKGKSPHLLVMSATPIPRTMALAFHGDMDISTIREKPKGRKAVKTAALPDDRTDEVIDAIRRALSRGERAFWICPAVDSVDAGDTAAAARRDILQNAVGVDVELVHGKLSSDDREAALERFRIGKSRLLVATTVVEVGVDVPDATIIVIERADKFGLAQLHQLRGRVGRGDKESSCLLLYKHPLTEAGKERLDILRRTNDGFAIAEADFKFRGAGDLLGSRQSGAPEFRVLEPESQSGLIEIARSDAKALLMGDPKLTSARGVAAKVIRDLLAPRLAALLKEPQRGTESP